MSETVVYEVDFPTHQLTLVMNTNPIKLPHEFTLLTTINKLETTEPSLTLNLDIIQSNRH